MRDDLGSYPRFLRIRFNTSEILVSLMLTYVAILLLTAMVFRALRDPDGFNFQSLVCSRCRNPAHRDRRH